MADSRAGSSSSKRKVTIRNSPRFTDAELIQLLELETTEQVEEVFSDDDEYFESNDNSDNSSDDDYQGIASAIAQQNIQQAQLTGQQGPVVHTVPVNVIQNWSDVPTNMNIFQFSKTNELLQTIAGDHPIDYFRTIFNDEILNLIVNETNHYARDLFISGILTKNSRIMRWKPVTSAEMLIFVGLLIHSGTIRLNRLQDYWKTHPLFNLKCFSQHMSRDRFLLIMRCLHFSRNITGQVADDRLHKIRPIITFFNNRMSALYYPGRELSLDESMMPWRGRLKFRQYIKNKRHKCGIKLYMLTEPNGLVLKSIVYTGVSDNIGGKGHTTKVVIKLLNNYLDSGHSVYMDNYYNSFELADILNNRNTYCTGTLSSRRRNNPINLITKKLKEGETAAVYSKGIMVGKWRNKRDVLYISTEHKNELIKFVDRRNRTKEKPSPIIHYNKYMGGVDQQDQLNSYYSYERKTLRWYKKLGIYYIQLMLLNSYLLYKKYSRRNLSFYDFRISVLEKLLNLDSARTPQVRDQRPHTLTKIITKNKKGETCRKRCRVCSKLKIRKMTLYHCQKCPDEPGLCVGKCFDDFHM